MPDLIEILKTEPSASFVVAGVRLYWDDIKSKWVVWLRANPQLGRPAQTWIETEDLDRAVRVLLEKEGHDG